MRKSEYKEYQGSASGRREITGPLIKSGAPKANRIPRAITAESASSVAINGHMPLASLLSMVLNISFFSANDHLLALLI